MHVLVVDDESVVTEGISRLIRLNYPEWRVSCCDSVREALTTIERDPPNLLLTDVRMPGSDGIQLCTEVRNRGFDIDMIMISAYDEFEYAQQAVRLGVRDYVLKPVQQDELIKLLNRVQAEAQLTSSTHGTVTKSPVSAENQFVERLVTGKLDKSHIDARNITTSLRQLLSRFTGILFYWDQDEADAGLRSQNPSDDGIDKVMSALGGTCRDTDTLILQHDPCELLVLRHGDSVRATSTVQEVLSTCHSVDASPLQAKVGSTYDRLDKLHAAVRELYYLQCDAKMTDPYTSAHAISGGDASEHTRGPLQSSQYDELLSTDFETLLSRIEDKITTHCLCWSSHAYLLFLNRLWAQIKAITSSLEQRQLFASRVTQRVTESVNQGNHDSVADHPFAVYSLAQDFVSNVSSSETLRKNLIATLLEVRIQLIAREKDSQQCIVEKTLQYIDSAFLTATLERTATSLGLSESYLSRTIKTKTGISFHNHLVFARMRAAQQLLRSTIIPVPEIADRVGYTDSKHFGQVFKGYCSETPREYRLKFFGK